ncbi:hypothetical protein LO762_26020 [Actinocorallia sp. API 0066]|uniref:hypothetical protein n=1 Tax=Actinocorallia sp. API 0066 TaxID=2896846 RepID=UPI001E2E6A6E|nr:hypothetical protein [Actinocorallia sp. API 0066]MCD0452613.1 hypothetical protein [Actinocorallia sp. API 0066]
MEFAFFLLKHARAAAVAVFVSALFALGSTGGDAVCFNGQEGDAPGECGGVLLSNAFVFAVAPALLVLSVVLFWATPALRRATLRDGYVRAYYRALRPRLDKIDAYARTDDAVIVEIWAAHEAAARAAVLACVRYQPDPTYYGLMAEAMVDVVAETTGCDASALREAGLAVSPFYRRFRTRPGLR